MYVGPRWVTFGLFLGAWGLVVGCGRQDLPLTEPSPPKPPGQHAVTLVLRSAGEGLVTPCGGAHRQLGGFPRTGTALAEVLQDAPNALYLESGSSVSGSTPFDRRKRAYLWQALQALKPAAVNLGPGDFTAGLDALRADAGDLPLLCANASAEGQPWRASVSRQVGEVRIGITGVCVFPHPTPAGMSVEEPEAALKRVLPDLARDHDLVVVLRHGPQAHARRLMETCPEIQVLLTSGCNSEAQARQMPEGLVLGAAGPRGGFLTRLDLVRKEEAWRLGAIQVLELGARYQPDPRQAEWFAAYHRDLEARPLAPGDTGLRVASFAGLFPAHQLAGTQVCISCHAEAGQTFQGSLHPQAFKRLSGGFRHDPDCLVCHTTAYGWPGGFEAPGTTPMLGGVGCENCHGPSLAHATRPLELGTVRRGSAMNGCQGCHTPDINPRFDLMRQWPQIMHGL
jgi:hypothetical protein